MAGTQALPDVVTVQSLSPAEQANILDLLFEPCSQLYDLSLGLLQGTAFGSYDDLIAGVGQQMYKLATSSAASDSAQLEGILSAHPRLGEKKTGAQSSAEQAQLHVGGDEQISPLTRCNQDYEKTFLGLRYVVFVNGRSRPEIMDDMRARIDRADFELERRDAIKAMCDIAADRARKLTHSA